METSSDPAGVKKINWRQFGRHWIVVFILAILAAFVIWGMLNASPWLKKLQDWRAARALQNQLEELYRNDKYGGKTPEETFDMFIAALEKGDVELASKYFVIEKQESWLRSLQTIKEHNMLGEMLDEMRLARDNSTKKVEGATAKFSYSLEIKETKWLTLPDGSKSKFPPGKYGADIIFENFFSKWKISEL